MAEQKKPDLTLQKIDCIIREVAFNRKLSKEAINQKAGIPPRGEPRK